MNSGFVDRNRPGGRESARVSVAEPLSTRDCVTVSELNRAVAQTLTRQFSMVWVSGEISNLTRASSGHCYFSLKDAGAQVRAVMFRHRSQYLPFALREGLKVECRAAVSLYEPRGDFQLNVEAMRQAGSGDLFQAFLALKAKLQAEGLFDAERKKSLPPQVSSVGVVTSLQAAALRDVLATLKTRAPQIRVVVYPCAVQGQEAAAGLRRAVLAAGSRREVDVLLLVRGGGSMEDLWSFNDEQLARAIAQCPLPTISGVGHETDFTICDFVADFRAPTPTAAASLAAPDRRELLRALRDQARALQRTVQLRYEHAAQSLDMTARLLRSPAQALAHDRRRLAQLTAQLQRAGRLRLQNPAWSIQRAVASLQPERLRQTLQAKATVLSGLSSRHRQAGQHAQQSRTRALEGLAQQLDLVSPLAVLERGYAIVRDQASGQILRQAKSLTQGQAIRLHLADGEASAQVISN